MCHHPIAQGVAQSRKVEARAQIGTVLSSPVEFDFGPTEKLVRINAIGSGLEEDDLHCLTPHLSKVDGMLEHQEHMQENTHTHEPQLHAHAHACRAM
jgi:citrate lyase beta subunit